MSGFVRVIAGKWRGRRLKVPDIIGLRPTPDRVRETVFNWLAPNIQGAHCLDAFAGSGAKDFHTYLLTFEKLADKTSIYKGTARIVRGGPKMVNDGNLTVLEIGISNWAFKNYGIDFKAICNTAKAETLATAKKESTKATQTDLPKGNVSKQASRRSLFSSKDPTSRSSALDSSKELIAAALGIDEKTITSIISSDIQLGIITDTFKDAETLFNAIKTKLPKKEYGGLLRLGGTFKDRNIVELSFEAKKDFEDFLTNKPTTKLRSL